VANRIVRWILTGDNRSAVKALSEIEDRAARTGGALERLGKDARHSLDQVEHSAKRVHGAIGGLAATIGVGGLAFGIKDVVESGMHWQTQQAQLRNSLRATGLAGQGLAESIRSINERVEESATRGGFGPATETAGIARFVTQTHSATKALQLNNEVVAVARRAGLDYAAAYSLVARAQTGQGRGLAKYIGIVQPVTSHVQALTLAHQQQAAHLMHLTAAQEAANPGLVDQLIAAKKLNPELLRHAQLLDRQATATEINARITQRLGGATAAYSHTAQGALSNAMNGYDAMKEQLGRAFLPVVTKVGLAMAGQARWMQRHRGLVLGLIGVTTAFAITLGTLKLAIVTVETATKAWAGIQAVLDAELLANPIGLVIVGIAALVAAVVLLVTHFNDFRRGVSIVFDWLVGTVKSVVGFFKKHWKDLLPIIAGPFAPLILVITHLKEVKRLAKDVIGLGGKLVHGAIGGVEHFVSHPFGLHEGGMVPAFAGGGPVGGLGNTDRVHALLKPGEFVLRQEVVSAVGVSNLNSLNSSGRIAPGGQPEVIELHHKSMIGPRVIAEEVTRYQLRQAART